MEREERRRPGGFVKRFTSLTKVSDWAPTLLNEADQTGMDFEQFAVGLDPSTIPEAAQFVARERELVEMHKLLYGHSTRSTVVLHGLGGMGKTQLAIEFARKHKE